MKRLGIFSISECDGKIDEYIIYSLNKLKNHVKDILVVINCNLSTSELNKLKTLNLEILKTKNNVSSFFSYKLGIDFIDIDRLRSYDELVLTNSSLFGPIFGLDEMFNKMSSKKLDIWSGVKSLRRDCQLIANSKQKYIDEYLHSSFLVLNNKILNSKYFHSYFQNLKTYSNPLEEFVFNESRFTAYFSKKGFICDSYIDSETFLSLTNDCSIDTCLELASIYNYPFVYRKSFTGNYNATIESCAGYQAKDLISFIDKHTDYDVNLIWDNLLRVEYQALLRNNLHLNYILPTNISYDSKVVNGNDKIALIMHLYYEDLIDYCYNYAKNMPDNIDVYLTVISNDMKQKVNNIFSKLKCNKLEIRVIENQGRDVSALLVGCADVILSYDYVCFMHDKKTLQLNPKIMGQDYSYHCFEGNLATKDYVNNIIRTFNDNPRLGFLTPPPPCFGSFYTITGFEWATDYKISQKIAKDLGLSVKLEAEPIAPFGTMFWFRSKALSKLVNHNWKYDDFPKEPTGVYDGTIMHAIERLYPLVAQDEGFYPAWVMPDYFGTRYLDNIYYMFRQLKVNLFDKYGFVDFNNMLWMMNQNISSKKESNKKISTKELKSFLKKYMKQKIKNLLEKIR